MGVVGRFKSREDAESAIAQLRTVGFRTMDISIAESPLRDGELLLSVQSDNGEWAARARDLLEDIGATELRAIR